MAKKKATKSRPSTAKPVAAKTKPLSKALVGKLGKVPDKIIAM